MADDFNRTIGKLEGTLDALDRRLGQIDHTLRDVQQGLVDAAMLKPKVEALEKRVATLEEGKAWVIKLVVGLIITAIVGTVLIKTGVPLPK